MSLNESTEKIDGAFFNGDGSGVEGHFKVHLYRSLLEFVLLNLVELYMTLIPLEGVQSVRNHVFKTILHVVVHSQIGFNQLVEFFNYLIWILFYKSL